MEQRLSTTDNRCSKNFFCSANILIIFYFNGYLGSDILSGFCTNAGLESKDV